MNSAYLAAQLTARRICEETGMSMADVAALPLDEWARLSGRATPAQAAIAAFEAQHEQAQPPAPATPQSPPQAPESQPQGIDPDSYEYFLAWRASRTSGGEGRGIFDSVGSQSDTYTSAVRAQAGRTALSRANVQEAPRLTGRTILRQDDMRDTRSVSDRFGTPGNFSQF